jgi:hypothetical protein
MPWLEPDIGECLQEAPEGCLLTRKHLARSKRKQAMKRNGRLVCKGCGFDFAVNYGNRGFGFIECLHTKPVAALAEGHKTHINDLALVGADCHRIIHRSRSWLSVADVMAIMKEAAQRWTRRAEIRNLPDERAKSYEMGAPDQAVPQVMR